MDYNVNPAFQADITTNSTNYDIFKNTSVINYLNMFNLTSEKIAKDGVKMKLTFLPNSPCTVTMNGIVSNAKDFYSSGAYTNVKSFLINETGVSGTLIIIIA